MDEHNERYRKLPRSKMSTDPREGPRKTFYEEKIEEKDLAAILKIPYKLSNCVNVPIDASFTITRRLKGELIKYKQNNSNRKIVDIVQDYWHVIRDEYKSKWKAKCGGTPLKPYLQLGKMYLNSIKELQLYDKLNHSLRDYAINKSEK